MKTTFKNVLVTILILIDGFLQLRFNEYGSFIDEVTILILIDGFLQLNKTKFMEHYVPVTILILIDGFLQLKKNLWHTMCH